MVWGCFYVAVWVFLVIYFITLYPIARREEETFFLRNNIVYSPTTVHLYKKYMLF